MLFREQVLSARKCKLSGDIVLTNTHTTWVFLGLIIVMLLGGVTWLAFGSFARTEQIPGFLRPSTGLVHISSALNGRVTKVSVAIGDVIDAKAKVAEVKNATLTGNGLDTVQEQLTALSKQIENAQSELDLDRKEAIRRRATLTAEIETLRQEIDAMGRQHESQTALLSIANERLDKLSGLASNGFATDVDIKSLQTESLNYQRGLDQIAQQRANLRRELILKRDQLAAIEPELSRKEIETERRVSDLTARKLDLTSKSGQTLTAPVASEVVAVTATEGTMVRAGQTLLSLRPVDSQIEARLMVPSSAIGFLAEGQSVKLQFAAFPYERFGSHDGIVRSVGKALVQPNTLDLPTQMQEAFYLVDVALSEDHITAFGARHPLQTGMQLTATIILERQSFLDWVLEPLRAVTERV